MTFRVLLYVFLNFVTLSYSSHSNVLSERMDKHVEANYRICLENFDVHKDKIIRTEDSRKMGAIYLNQIDVESRIDCLKFCCQTDGCDVFIFEEKKPGSCYLFQCGPLYDFKCKFTDHANYSSAVRTNYDTQSAAQLEEEIQITQQEHELKSLRKQIENVPPEYTFTEPVPKVVTPTTTKATLTTPVVVKPVCSRNQYECRSNGECIAIYNVCDGIPQCSDGSDEAADLVCPTEKPTILPSPVFNQQQPQILPPIVSPDLNKYQLANPRKYPISYDYDPNVNQGRAAYPLQPELAYPAAMQQPDNAQPLSGRIYPPQSYQWQLPPVLDPDNRDFYNVLRSYHEQVNANKYEQPTRIFNHKNSGVSVGKNSDRNENTESLNSQRLPQPNPETWRSEQAPTVQTIVEVKKVVDEVKRINDTTTTPPCVENLTDNEKSEKHNTDTIKETTKLNKDSNENVKKPAKNHLTTVDHEPKKNEVKDDRKLKKASVADNHASHTMTSVITIERLKQTIEDEVFRPKGAVISLALGLTATAITAALIACRLRVVRRRGRRGRGSFAHDADYLVNGMYL